MVITSVNLQHDEQSAINDLLKLYQAKQVRNALRKDYYDSKNVLQSLGIAIPVELELLNVVLGWPAIAVDTLADRCVLTGFTSKSGDAMGMDQVMDDNDLHVQAEIAHLGAAKFGCHLAFVTAREGGGVRVALRPATHATAAWDHRTARVKSALSITEADYLGRPTAVNMYLPGRIVMLEKASGAWRVQRLRTQFAGVPVVPLRHRPDDDHPLGTSRITRPIMALTDSAMRTWARSEVAAEFFSAPQRYLINASKDLFLDDETGEARSQWESIIGRIWAIPPQDDLPEGAKVEVGQFAAASQQPHMDQLRQTAAFFAGHSRIPAEMLGVKADSNPTSEGALDVLERPLVVEANKAIRTFKQAWRRIAQLALMTRDHLDAPSDEAMAIQASFLDPRLPSVSQVTDAIIKQVQAGILPAESDVPLEGLGYDQPTIDRIKAHRLAAGPQGFAALAAAMSRQTG